MHSYLGIIFAGVGVIGMALTNFLVGTSSHQMPPMLIVWFIHTAISLQCLIYLKYHHQLKSLFSLSKKTLGLTVGSGFLNNMGWLGFAFSTTLIPISIAATISEGFIALAILLGIFVNREKLQTHQKIGIVMAIIGIMALSFFSSN